MIKKGERYKCIEDFVMNSGEIAYTKGVVYTCQIDGALTDNNGEERHWMNMDFINESFIKEEHTPIQPDHYGGENNPFEVRKFISAHNLNFNRGSVVKYTVRAGIKDPDREIEDLEKAIKFLQFEIEHLKEKK